MNDHFKTIAETLIKEGFQDLKAENLDFKITPYSLNTKLSFKFDSLEHFVEFYKLHHDDSTEKITALQATFIELGLDSGQFFYVNFFERGKEAEM